MLNDVSKVPMNDSLRDARDAVSDEASFVGFLAALAADRIDEEKKERLNPSSPFGPGANGWENGTISQFLDSAVAWAISSQEGLSLIGYNPPTNPWRRCADILYAAKIYE